MACIQYFSEANSKFLNDSCVALFKEYGISIPQTFENSKQLFTIFNRKNNQSFATEDLLISFANQRQKESSIRIWSDELIARRETLRKIVDPKINKLNKPKQYSKIN